MQFIIVTGMSGAGKSIAIRALEDMGIYCVDNLPPELLYQMFEICSQQPNNEGDRIAVVADIRSLGRFSCKLQGVLANLQKNAAKIVFLDACDEEIINRYKMTRRRHPLLGEGCNSLSEAIAQERRQLAELRDRADFVIDTSLLSTQQLRCQMQELFTQSQKDTLVVHCMSFGFKYGVPTDADLMFDVRCLPNPFYKEELREHNGLEKPVRDFVMDCPETQGMLQRLYSFLDYMLPLYCNEEQKSQLGIAIGCTGGRHRSVAVAQALAEHIEQLGYVTIVNHRDIERKKFNH